MASNDPGRSGKTDLGYCPHCETPIPAGRLLIKYETADGWPKTFAECPTCEGVVHPA
jgi:hypothetical protein